MRLETATPQSRIKHSTTMPQHSSGGYGWDMDTQARMGLGCSSKISCAVLVPEEFAISLQLPSKHVKSDHYRPASKTPSERRFAGGPIVARDWILAGHMICRGRPLNSHGLLSVERQTVLTQIRLSLHCLQKIFLKCSSRRQNRSALEILFISIS